MHAFRTIQIALIGFLSFYLASCQVAPPIETSDTSAATTNSSASSSSQPSAIPSHVRTPTRASRNLKTSASTTGKGQRIRGIDVSDNVGSIDWSAVKVAGYPFAFVKATDGVSYSRVDYFFENWPKMKAAGIIRGAYHFYESDDDPVAQANYFADTLAKGGGLEAGDLPPVLDFERATSGANVMKFLQQLKSRTGRNPIIYVDESFANQYLSDPAFASYPLWLAEYGVSTPKVPDPWEDAGRSWSFWQSSEGGTVSGVPGGNGATDLDWFPGSVGALKRFIQSN